MPTFETLPRFKRDLKDLDPAQLMRFKVKVIDEFVPAIDAGPPYPNGLRIKGVQGKAGVYEMTWAPDGRATWQFGDELIPGKPHIIWRRIGTHDIFEPPPGP